MLSHVYFLDEQKLYHHRHSMCWKIFWLIWGPMYPALNPQSKIVEFINMLVSSSSSYRILFKWHISFSGFYDFSCLFLMNKQWFLLEVFPSTHCRILRVRAREDEFIQDKWFQSNIRLRKELQVEQLIIWFGWFWAFYSSTTCHRRNTLWK